MPDLSSAARFMRWAASGAASRAWTWRSRIIRSMCCSNTPSRAAGRFGCAGCWRACRAKSLRKIKVVSKRRAEALPYGAVVLERLLEAGEHQGCGDLGLWPARRPVLCAACRRKNAPRIRWWNSPAAPMTRLTRACRSMPHEMFDWTAPLFEGESAELRAHPRGLCLFLRHRLAAPSRRPRRRRLRPGADRALRRRRPPRPRPDRHRRSSTAIPATRIFPATWRWRACWTRMMRSAPCVLGLAWRFAFSLSASAAGELAALPPAHDARPRSCWKCPRRREAIAGEPVQKRLGALADALGRKGEILVG